jgi:hypothetical protein
MSPIKNPRGNIGWRTNTLAEKPGHRHEHGELKEAPPGAWKPSDGYTEQDDGWRPLVVWVASGIGLVCMVAWAIKEWL